MRSDLLVALETNNPSIHSNYLNLFLKFLFNCNKFLDFFWFVLTHFFDCREGNSSDDAEDLDANSFEREDDFSRRFSLGRHCVTFFFLNLKVKRKAFLYKLCTKSLSAIIKEVVYYFCCFLILI